MKPRQIIRPLRPDEVISWRKKLRAFRASRVTGDIAGHGRLECPCVGLEDASQVTFFDDDAQHTVPHIGFSTVHLIRYKAKDSSKRANDDPTFIVVIGGVCDRCRTLYYREDGC